MSFNVVATLRERIKAAREYSDDECYTLEDGEIQLDNCRMGYALTAKYASFAETNFVGLDELERTRPVVFHEPDGEILSVKDVMAIKVGSQFSFVEPLSGRWVKFHSDDGTLEIGCQCHTLAHWREHGETIIDDYVYNVHDRNEYYIQLRVLLDELEQNPTPAKRKLARAQAKLDAKVVEWLAWMEYEMPKKKKRS